MLRKRGGGGETVYLHVSMGSNHESVVQVSCRQPIPASYGSRWLVIYVGLMTLLSGHGGFAIDSYLRRCGGQVR